MENKDIIIGQLMDQGYDFDDIQQAFEGASDTADIIKKLELIVNKKSSKGSEAEKKQQSMNEDSKDKQKKEQQVKNMTVNRENKSVEEVKEKVNDKRDMRQLGFGSSEEENEEQGIEVLIRVCRKEIRKMSESGGLYTNSRAVEYTMNLYK